MSKPLDVNQRWEKGIDHNPKSVQLGKMLAQIDMLYGGDSFDFKFGGDGDNGENLLYLLDIYFDAEFESQFGDPDKYKKLYSKVK